MDFFISHLPHDTSELHLKKFFYKIGDIKAVKFVPQSQESDAHLLAIVTVAVKRELLVKLAFRENSLYE